ncbi:ABC transporter permease [Actinoplanes sp. NPDC048967]|uniref:ABC transporter permease n=1 Tax=Actinoplanes sp. NPDC048967 TaxID=3155269 RepID=UPI0033D7AD72
MTTDERPATPPAQPTRSLPHPVRALTAHALRGFTRSPGSAFFTLIFPLAFLSIVSAVVGNEMTGAGVPVAQFLVAPFAVFGVAEATFVVLATDTAGLRERGVLMRLRGTPGPVWTVLAARVAAMAVVSAAATALLTGVGAGFYGVHLVWRKTPALLLTLAVGIGCFSALGLALVALTRTALIAQTLTQGLLIPLAFISDVFIVGADLPAWLDRIGSALPLRHFARAMAQTFDPAGGYGFRPADLLMMAAWGLLGAVVALRRFGWMPRGSRSADVATAPVRTGPAPAAPELRPVRTGRRTAPALLLGQIRYALTSQWRDPLAVFFAVIFPVLLLGLFPTVFGAGPVHGLTAAQYLLPGLTAYAIAVAGYVNMPEDVAQARGSGVLKRLLGTPLALRWYVAGRIFAVLVVSVLSTVLLCAVAVLFLDVRIDVARWPALAVGLVLGVSCFACLGLAAVALLRSATSLVAVTLGTLLPLSFVSDVFMVGDVPPPGWLAAVGNLFPLKHLAAALLAATSPAGPGTGIATGHLAVVAAWTVAGLLVVRLRGLHRD